MDFDSVLYKRRSIRSFKPLQIDDATKEKIIDAAYMSPSGHNANPCELIVVDDKDLLEKLSKTRTNSKMLLEASLCVVVIGDIEKSTTVAEDGAIMMENMHLECVNLGLGSCFIQIKGRETASKESSEEYVRRLLEIPSNYMVCQMLAIGFPNEMKEIKNISSKATRTHFNRF